MSQVPPLISDLALILSSAAIVSLVFKKLKQPQVLGYILAGLLVGPYFDFFPTITGYENVHTWSEIGVIFLLFTLGLEFSFKKLMKVGGSSSITAFVQIIFMLFLGYFGAQLMGWSQMDSIFLGAILSMSSTTIIIRAFDELNMKNKKFAGVVFGALIVEDLVAIVLMVLLSTLAVSREFAGMEMLFSILKLLFFLILWFAAGIFFIPSFLKAIKSLISDETLLVVSIGLCFIMVLIAANVGFSPALGAFIMGSILAETTKAERIEHLVKPVKDLFGAVFFVSVGMLIDPSVLNEYAVPIIVITLITIFGKTFSTFLGALISGQPLKQSVQAGMSLAQIGEFSFIIASLGLTLEVTSPFLYPVTVAVSAITTFTTPYLINASEPFYLWLEQKLPVKWAANINQYSAGAQHINAESEWKRMIRSFFQISIINGVVITGIIVLFSKVIAPYAIGNYISEPWGSVFLCSIALLCTAPFLWTLTSKKIGKATYTALWLNKYNRGPLIALEFLRVAFAIFLVGFLLDQFFSTLTAFIVAIVVILIASVVFSKKLQEFSAKIEERFLRNFNERETANPASKMDKLTPWDAHIAYFEVLPFSFVVGKKLMELELRERYGVNIAMIERGEGSILVPKRDELLYPHDRIAVIGTDEQLAIFKNMIEKEAYVEEITPLAKEDLALVPVIAEPGFPFLGQTIRESGIREKTQGLIVGIERNGERILNPESTTEFQAEDAIWIVGNKKLIKKLFTYSSETSVSKSLIKIPIR